MFSTGDTHNFITSLYVLCAADAGGNESSTADAPVVAHRPRNWIPHAFVVDDSLLPVPAYLAQSS